MVLGDSLTMEHIRKAVEILSQQSLEPYYAIGVRTKKNRILVGDTNLYIVGEEQDEKGFTYLKVSFKPKGNPISIRVYESRKLKCCL